MSSRQVMSLVAASAVCAAATGQDAVVLDLGRPAAKRVTALHFGANVEFFRAGLYFGTLPRSDPRSRRREFARALRDSGIRSLRFSGDRAERGDPAAFVSGDLRMDRWLDAAARTRESLGIAGAPIAVTETTVMRHRNWRPHAIVGTHAHALVYAWNWIELMGHPLC